MWVIFFIIFVVVGLLVSFVSFNMREPLIEKIGCLIAVVSIICIGLCCFTNVPAGHVGVPVIFGKVDVNAKISEGLSIVNPFSKVYNDSILTEKYIIKSPFKDQSLDVIILYRLIYDDAGWVRQKFGENWRDILVYSASKTSVQEVCDETNKLEIETKISEKISQRIQNLVSDRCDKPGQRIVIKIVDIQLVFN